MPQRIAASLVLVTGLFVLAGSSACSAAPGDAEGASSEQAITIPKCTTPFEALQVACSDPDPQPPGGSGGLLQSTFPRCQMECLPVVESLSPPYGPSGGCHEGPGYGYLPVTPSGPFAGCTVGSAFQYGYTPPHGSVYACPAPNGTWSSAPGASFLHPLCTLNGIGHLVDPAGGPTCEIVTTSTSGDDYCVGKASSGWTVVADFVVPSGSLPSQVLQMMGGTCRYGCN